MVFKSLTVKLLALMLLLSLAPLLLISTFSYFLAKNRITEDRVKLFLEQLALDTADKIDLMLLEKREEVRSMAAMLPLSYLEGERRAELVALLNRMAILHEVYDLLIITDADGQILATNSIDRFGLPIPPGRLNDLLGRRISEFPAETPWFQTARSGRSSQIDFYCSPLAQSTYGYSGDICQQYNIAFAEPIFEPATGQVVAVWCNIVNWEYVQRILDNVEADLEALNLKSGYAFLLQRDGNTTIGHKYRKNRPLSDNGRLADVNNYGKRIVEDHKLIGLYQAIMSGARSFRYEYPPGTKKISGLARISDPFGWVCGVGINDTDIFAPIDLLKYIIIAATALLAIAVAGSTYLIATGISRPLGSLTATAQVIARGDLSQRVAVDSQDEIGALARAFNQMAEALEQRNRELLDLNQTLEQKVRERTAELERSNQQLKSAYLELRSTQEQLIHSEKLASLGQLVAGIAHEIKNPLNFIYGNTEFLARYVEQLKQLLAKYEELRSISAADRAAIARLKDAINYDFLLKDLETLVANFSEGAKRINAIISDLRAFSRMDLEKPTEVDLHRCLEIALNLLRNQYQDRITIVREYGAVPMVKGYAGKLNQVFMNLLSNAIQAIPERGQIWITTLVERSEAVVKIRDSGIGIPHELMGKIFEPFFTTKPVGQGTGLGLSISYGIIQQHGGRIEVESEPGRGSTFSVRLPLEPLNDPQGETRELK